METLNENTLFLIIVNLQVKDLKSLFSTCLSLKRNQKFRSIRRFIRKRKSEYVEWLDVIDAACAVIDEQDAHRKPNRGVFNTSADPFSSESDEKPYTSEFPPCFVTLVLRNMLPRLQDSKACLEAVEKTCARKKCIKISTLDFLFSRKLWKSTITKL